jgi:predicted extracellular nuclease
VGGNVRVATLNLLNYFLTLDDSGAICGPDQNLECRGADDAEELERQRAKLLDALARIDGDVVGLVEMENTPGVEPAADLVDRLNDLVGAGTYAFIDTGIIGTDAIRVGLIYKPALVRPIGDFAILDSSVDPDFLDDKNRPVLAQTFEDPASGERFTVAVNHLKSKGSPCDDVGDPDLGDGQGNCNLTRTAAAEALVDWLDSDPTGSGDGRYLIVGDLNSYDKEDPIDALLAGGYTDLVGAFGGELAYSYVFDGQFGYLDYAMASSDLVSAVTGTTVWHINADEPDLLDYDTTFKQPAQDALYEPNAFRSSDHDPVIVGLDLEPPKLRLRVEPQVLWPANHKYVRVVAKVKATDNESSPEVRLVSVTSNEPDDGVADGSTTNDIVILDDRTFLLRAERSGTGAGRVYTITYEARDEAGNAVLASASVWVPLSRSVGR